MRIPPFHKLWLDTIALNMISRPGEKLMLSHHVKLDLSPAKVGMPPAVRNGTTYQSNLIHTSSSSSSNDVTQQVMQPTESDSSRGRRHAAVLISLCNRNDVPSVLFTLRSMKLSTHKGQVSFPGGHIESNESAVEAAIRETYEELGNDIGSIEILGVCQTIPSITGTLVTPILGFLNEDVREFESFSPNVDEVDRVFTRSLIELNDPSFRTIEKLSRNGITIDSPSFGSGEERIWGFTAFVLDAVLSQVVVPTIPRIQSKI